MGKKILVNFGNKLPRKNNDWWQKFDAIIMPQELKIKKQEQIDNIINIEDFIDSGSVQEAYELVNKLSRLILSNGSRLSKIVTYKGYEIWWMDYDNLCHQFCLPYTQYQRLLDFLKNFEEIYIYNSPNNYLFSYFLTANGRKCVELIEPNKKIRNYFIPAGIFVQLVLSALFILPLIIIRPKIMFWTNDIFSPQYKGDFRHRFFYQAFKEKKVRFVQFIRSIQPWHRVLGNVLQRKRAVIYPSAIIEIIHSKFGFFEKKEYKKIIDFARDTSSNPDDKFLFLIATHYLKNNIRATCWSINTIKWILKLIGVKTAVITSSASRTFHTILACKLAGIKTVGIQHGVIPRYFLVADFMPDFNGDKKLTLDAYGLWSKWWRDYYIKYSKAYAPEQLFISGPIRPIEKKVANMKNQILNNNPIKVLFISEEVADPKEAILYLSEIIKIKDFNVSLKLRPQLDGFEEWLKKNKPEILKNINIFKGDIHDAAVKSDILIGSYSTAVLEGLAELKPFVFFETKKWGDYFDMKSFADKHHLLAENPKDLIDKIKKNVNMPKEELKKLQEQFLGNPYQNGSKWVVEKSIEYLNFSKKK